MLKRLDLFIVGALGLAGCSAISDTTLAYAPPQQMAAGCEAIQTEARQVQANIFGLAGLEPRLPATGYAEAPAANEGLRRTEMDLARQRMVTLREEGIRQGCADMPQWHYLEDFVQPPQGDDRYTVQPS
ncbi:MAG: hypothetical protein AB7L41_10620 [Flavobacteriaceae bacterium]